MLIVVVPAYAVRQQQLLGIELVYFKPVSSPPTKELQGKTFLYLVTTSIVIFSPPRNCAPSMG
jgi:hypothetical protein